MIDWNGFGDDAGDDYGRRDDLSDFAPPRMLAQVSDAGGPIWGWNVLGADGCTPVFDTSAEVVTIEFFPWSRWSATGNQVVALDCDTSDDCELLPQTSPPLPVTSGVEAIVYDTATSMVGRRFQFHWAMAFSEERAAYHVAKTFYGAIWDTQANTKGAQSDLLIAGRPTVSLRGSDTIEKKYTITHEFGHLQNLVSIIPNSLNLADLDYCYPLNCATDDGADALFNHSFDSLEWQSAAAAEGFAHFYAMSVWNDLGETAGVLAAPGEDELEIIAYRTDDENTSLYETNFGMKTDGTAIERDWCFFLWDLATGTGAIDIQTVMLLLAEAYDPWPTPSDTKTDWWDHFETEAHGTLTATEESKFDGHADERWVNQ